MKCNVCGDKADYVVQGTSLCSSHRSNYSIVFNDGR